MKDTLYYVVCWLLNKHKYFLLWYEGEHKDYYVLNQQYFGKLLIAKTEQELVKYANEYSLQLADESAVIFDFDAVYPILSKLKSYNQLSEKSAKLLLSIWNAFDDVANSVNMQIMPNIPKNLYTQKDIDRLYEKIFWSNNLPSITPANKKYHSIFIAKERSLLRRIFIGAIKNLTVVTL